MKFAVALGLICSMTIWSSAAAQEPVPTGTKESVKPALLMMVKDGVFELQRGKSIDVTDRKILVSFVNDGYNIDDKTGLYRNGIFYVTINGEKHQVSAGTRIDLKKENSTNSFVGDIDVCMLDVVELIEAKGTAARTVMRINCQ